MVQVEGAVWQPGPVKIDGNMTIDEAIAAAGGLAQYADEDDIKLIRKDQEGKRLIIQLTMNDIQAMKQGKGGEGAGLPWQQLLLQDGDVVYAEASGLRSFYSGVGFTIGFLGTGVQYRNPVQPRAQTIREQPTE
jgi:polysaccharide export outer membrane protein